MVEGMPTLLLVSLLAAPDLAAEVARCAAVKDSLQRLTCFDGVAATATTSAGDVPATPPPDASSDPVGVGDWRVGETKDEISGAVSHVATLEGAGTNRFGKPATLIVRCSNGRWAPSLVIFWGEHLGGDRVVVQLRLDEAEAEQETWDVSVAGTHSISPSIAGMKRIEAFRSRKKLAVRVHQKSGPPITSVFTLDGAAAAIDALRKGCPGK